MRYLVLCLLITLSFWCGFFTSAYIKPPLPEVGRIEIVGSFEERVGSLYCFDEESFDNLGDLLIEMSKEFQEYE